MKKLLLSGVLMVAGLVLIKSLHDPLNALASFLIAGVVPGTNIMLGMWPTIGIGLVGFWLLIRWLRRIRLQALELTAKQIKSDTQITKQVVEKGISFNQAERSVIAAPTSRATF